MTIAGTDFAELKESLNASVFDLKEVVTVSSFRRAHRISPSTVEQLFQDFVKLSEDSLHVVYCLSGYVTEHGQKHLQLLLSTSQTNDDFDELLSCQFFSLQLSKPTNASSQSSPFDEQSECRQPRIAYWCDNKSEARSVPPVSVDVPSTSKGSSNINKKNTKPPSSGSIQSMFTKSNESKPKTADPAKKKPAAKPGAKPASAFFGEPVAKVVKKETKKTEQAEVFEDSEPEEVTEFQKSPSPVKKKRSKHQRVRMDDSDEEEEEKTTAGSPVSSPVKDSPVKATEDIVCEEDSPTSAKENKSSAVNTKNTNSGNRKRQKVLKDVTHVDEDGFLVTTKVWEEVSCDEDEVVAVGEKKDVVHVSPVKLPEPLPNVAPAAKSKKTTKSSTAKNQHSLTSFFQKK